MSEEVRRLISGLDQARDVNRHWQAIDRWVSDEDDDRLRELAVSLLRMESDVEPRPWQPGSLLDHLRGRLALSPGRWSTAFLIDQLITAAMPVRQLRESAARLASAQEPKVIIAALEEHQGETELAEFLYVLTHEAVLIHTPGEAGFEIAVEPPLDGAWSDGQVGGDILVGPAPVGQPDDLEAVPELRVGRLAESLFESLGFGFGESDADQGDGCRLSGSEGVCLLYEPDSLIGRVNESRISRLGHLVFEDHADRRCRLPRKSRPAYQS